MFAVSTTSLYVLWYWMSLKKEAIVFFVFSSDLSVIFSLVIKTVVTYYRHNIKGLHKYFSTYVVCLDMFESIQTNISSDSISNLQRVHIIRRISIITKNTIRSLVKMIFLLVLNLCALIARASCVWMCSSFSLSISVFASLSDWWQPSVRTQCGSGENKTCRRTFISSFVTHNQTCNI